MINCGPARFSHAMGSTKDGAFVQFMEGCLPSAEGHSTPFDDERVPQPSTTLCVNFDSHSTLASVRKGAVRGECSQEQPVCLISARLRRTQLLRRDLDRVFQCCEICCQAIFVNYFCPHRTSEKATKTTPENEPNRYDQVLP